jgi:hypothetical protein
MGLFDYDTTRLNCEIFLLAKHFSLKLLPQLDASHGTLPQYSYTIIAGLTVYYDGFSAMICRMISNMHYNALHAKI